tara:strand:+ start:2538 stop:2711 length:174 start_codon:yes stop_codon:yes gene_type:complete
MEPMEVIAATNSNVQDYINSLPWSEDASEEQKTLVAGNIQGFWQFLVREKQANRFDE